MATNRTIRGLSGRGFRVTNSAGDKVTVKESNVALVDVDDQNTQTILSREKDNFVRTLQDAGTATVSIATPAVVSKATHGYAAGDVVVLTTTGALPTGLTAGQAYYVQATGLTSGQFRVAETLGGADINTTGSQSGTHTLTPGSTSIIGLTAYGVRIPVVDGTLETVKLGSGVHVVNLTDGRVTRVLKRSYGRFLVSASASTLDVRGLQEQQNGFELNTPVALTAAEATLSSNGTTPADNDTVVVNDVTYRFKTTIALANDVDRGASSNAALDNLVAAINQSGTPGTEYFAGTVAPTDVTSAARTGTGATGAIVLTASTAGAAGNAYASTVTGANLSFGGATFAGGADADDGTTPVYKTVTATVDPSLSQNFTQLRRHFKSYIEV